ncbi:hypothetical protein BGZ54_008694, partial [Gamsiella multidivaricata]
MLKMERSETKINFDTTAAKTARIVQDAILKETSRAAGLLENESNSQDKLECSARPKRKMQQGGSFKESNKQVRTVDETSTSWEIDEDVTTISRIQGTTTNSEDDAGAQGLAATPQPHFNLDSVRRITLTMARFDVGAAFRRLQEEAVPFINDESLKVSVKKLCLMFSKKLPPVALPSIADNEDTYSHGALDSLFSFFFPASDFEYRLWWANRPSPGSRKRRGVKEANKPDGTVMKKQFDVAFAEIKAPKDDNSTRLYIQDKWALTSLAKNIIDLHLHERRTITSIYCLQVF